MRSGRWIGLPLVVAIMCVVGCAGPGSVRLSHDQSSRPRPKHYECKQAPGPIVVDGKPDDEAWRAASWSDAFVDIRGAGFPTPRYATRMKMLWDRRYLYVLAELVEPHVTATLTKRDDIVFHDNDFEVFLDPDGDAQDYFEIEVNALNTIFDLFLVRTYLDGGPADHDWNVLGLRSAVHVDGTLNDPSDVDRGWSVEFAIPWSALAPQAGVPLPPNPGDTWRMNFSRVEWQYRIIGGHYEKVPNTSEDNWVWSPQGEINMHLPHRWGYVTFVADEQ